MKTLALFGTFFIIVGTCVASVRDQIDRQYKRWATAAVKNDVETILAIMAPDYTLKTYTGMVIDHKKYEASLRKRRETNQPTDAYQTEIAQISVKGTTASVISNETSSKLTTDPITNKRVNMIHVHRYEDTWIKSGKTWKLKSTVTQQESTKVIPVGK